MVWYHTSYLWTYKETNNSVLRFAKHHVFDLYVAKRVSSRGPVGITIESPKTNYESDLLFSDVQISM